MKNYSIDIGEVIAYLGIGLFFLMLILAIVHIYNKSKYKKIVKLYKDKYGRLPLKALIFTHGSLIIPPYGYISKVDFIIYPLFFSYKKKFLFHDMTEGQYLFIRALPSNLLNGFKLEAFVFIASAIIMLLMFLMYCLYK